MLPPLARGVVAAEAIDALQALSHDVSAGIGDAALRNQAAAERDFADQFPGQRAPAEGAANDGGDLPLLLHIADVPAAGCADQECHADLVYGKKGGIAGK